MWCRSCQQDVPGVAAASDASRVCCPRCNSTLSSGAALASLLSTISIPDSEEGSKAAPPAPENPTGTASIQDDESYAAPPPLNFDDWQYEDDIRTVRRVLGTIENNRHSRFDAGSDEPRTSDGPSPHFPTSRSTSKVATPTRPVPEQKPANPRLLTGKPSWFSWLLMAIGLMTFVCGAVLLGWYFHDAQEHLWRIGLPLTLGGQVALLFGLIAQLETLWQNSRGTKATLDELDQQIDELRQTATVINSTSSGAAKSFYLHVAEGASPEVLLADLKGQIDVLALKMAKQR